MPTLRSFRVPALAGIVLAAGAIRAQDVPLDQIHPRTMLTVGVGFGDQDLETNTGAAVVSRSNDSLHIRLRGEHFFESDFGIFGNVFFGIADDINEDIGATGSSFDSFGIYLAAAYRATMGERFRLPVRFGPFIQNSEEDADQFIDGAVERSMIGVRLSAEPEVILMQQKVDGKVTELSVFADLACGAGPAEVEDDVDSEDAYAFTLAWELGVRYRFRNGILASISWYSQKFHIGTTESYNNTAFFGVDDDFSGILLTAGLRF